MLFAMKYLPPNQQPFLVVMPPLDKPGETRVIVDPNGMSDKGSITIDWFVPSPDGKKLAVSLSEGGTETGH